MKRLVLLRHAKSSWAEPGGDDFDRPLNPRGLRDAPEMGRRLAQRRFCPDRILVSPAQRTRQTVNLLLTEIEGEPPVEFIPSIYEASAGDLLTLVRSLDDADDAVLLIGHNPGMSDLAAFLVEMPFSSLPTCGMVAVNFLTDAWGKIEGGNVKLEFYDAPKRPFAGQDL